MDQSPPVEHLSTRYAAMRVLVHAADLDDAAPEFLATLGRAFAWDFGVLWIVRAGALQPSHQWAAPGLDADALGRATRALVVTRGQSPLGQVWASGEPRWIDRLAGKNPRDAALAAAGLGSALVLPLTTAGGVHGVLELFCAVSETVAEGPARIARELAGDLAFFVERVLADERARADVEQQVRESQSRLRQLYESDLIGIIMCDLGGRVRDANDAFLRMLGYSRAELDAGAIRWDEITPSEWADDDRAALHRIRTTGTTGTYAKEYVHCSGVRVPIVLGATLLHGSDEECICFVIDDSARKAAEDQLARLNEELESRVQERTESLRASEQKAERAAHALAYSEQQLRALATRLQTVREEERTDLAREIHDVLGQELTGLKMDAAWMSRRLATRHEHELAAATARLGSMRARIDETIGMVRRLATGLRPGVLDDLGLATAIEWQAHEFGTRAGLPIEMAIADVDLHVDSARATAVFRIFQELLTNVARHAAASRVEGRLAVEDGDLVLEVRDDGRGIAESEVFGCGSLGLVGIRERVLAFGGAFTVARAPDRGTQAIVRIPVGGSTP